jgi:hypothetical protein
MYGAFPSPPSLLLCSLTDPRVQMNEFRQFLGLKRTFDLQVSLSGGSLKGFAYLEFESFEEWNSNQEIAVRGYDDY